MKPFERLKAWEEAHRLYVQVYESSESWPIRERYGLTAQIRRSALSVGSNIAEGVVRRTPAEFARFIEIALGSLSELSYQLIAARDVKVLPLDGYACLDAQRETASKLIWRLYRGVRQGG
jgi:four helix bundle protein